MKIVYSRIGIEIYCIHCNQIYPFPVPPSVPNVTVDAVTATTITISWSQDPTDTIDHSVVMYDYMGPCFGRGVISELFSLGSSTRNHVIADLRPNSQYLVIVDTQNAAGSSASEVNVFTASAGNFFSKGSKYMYCRCNSKGN